MLFTVPTPSRGFVSAMAGIGLTLLAWYGPWSWPAWPALAAMQLSASLGNFSELALPARAAALTLLIAINVGTWAGLLLAGAEALSQLRRRLATRA